MTVIRKDLPDNIVIEHKKDLINHPYFVFLEIRDLD